MAGQTEVKVWGAVIGSAAAGFGIAILNSVQEQPELLGGLPVWIQGLALTVIPGFVTWFGGWVKKSRTSVVSDGFRPELKDA